MGVLKFKILRDLWGNKSRTLQVILIIGIGAGSIGMIMGVRNMLIPEMARLWQAMNPAMIQLVGLSPPLDADELNVLKREDGVSTIEGTSNTIVEWRLSPQDEWKQGELIARADYEAQKLFVLELVEGKWPEGKTIAIGQDSAGFFNIPPSGEFYLRVNDRDVKVHSGGTIYNMNTTPASLGGTAQFFSSLDYFERLTERREFDRVLVNAPVYDEEAVTKLADRLQEKLEKQEVESGRIISNPEKMFFQDQMDGVFGLLSILGMLALALGLLLVYNTINALISQQVDQIGVMKAVGARTWQVLWLYLVNILAFSVLALMISLPIGVLGAWVILSTLVSYFGADPGTFSYSTPAVITQSLLAFLAPLLAAIFPVLNGARITVREAISTYGLSSDTGLIERALANARYISRLVLITIGNTFRHKWRVILTQVALVLSGLMFMTVVTVRDSVVYTIQDILFSILNADITFIFEEPQRISHIEELALAHPDVEQAEMWGLIFPTIRPASQAASEDDDSAFLFGVPLPTQLYGYQLRGGRWLKPDDGYAIVIHQDLAKEIGVGVGDWVTLKYNENQERDWQVVGLVFDPVIDVSANVPREVLLRDIHSIGKVETAWIKTRGTNLEGDVTIAKDLREYFEENQVDVSPQLGIFNRGDTTYETGNSLVNFFNFLVALLGVMAVVIGIVGSIALSGALSMSVLERRREIGVMRAIGASSWTIARMFIGEGLILGWLSWLISLPLAIPAGQLMVLAVGQFFGFDFVYKFTPTGPFLWFIIITILAILASGLPSRGATRISVQESLAYNQ